jgi:hypothetical protein
MPPYYTVLHVVVFVDSEVERSRHFIDTRGRAFEFVRKS